MGSLISNTTVSDLDNSTTSCIYFPTQLSNFSTQIGSFAPSTYSIGDNVIVYGDYSDTLLNAVLNAAGNDISAINLALSAVFAKYAVNIISHNVVFHSGNYYLSIFISVKIIA